ncbi:MAG TPA: ABC transporter permease subunit [Alphaproteobacteria bacterium]|jgi:NitT/TauT family transport system permease protein|nr:ABC transporter permease subunit [Alphaproteobacteria bacterium]
MELFGRRLPYTASLLIWAVLWEAVGHTDAVLLLPPLSSVVVRIFEIVPTETFMEALALTARAFVIGVGVSLLVGVPLGIVMGRVELIDRLILPWVNLFVSAPLTALVPVIMALFGFGETTIILTVILFTVWIVVLDARAGTRAISTSLIEMARSYGATPWQALTKIYIWAALPEILAGVRLGLVRAVKGVIIGQLLVSVVGFGHMFEIYQSNFLMEHLWALLLLLFVLAFLIDGLLGYLEKRVEYYAATRN